MSARPHNGRMTPTHSLGGALAIALFIAAVAFIIFMTCGGARAAPTCMPWPVLKQILADTFAEVPIGGGVLNGQAILEVAVSPNGRSFTIVVVDTSGEACPVLYGTGWEPGATPSKPLPAKPERQG